MRNAILMSSSKVHCYEPKSSKMSFKKPLKMLSPCRLFDKIDDAMGQPPCVIYWLDDARGQGSGSPCVIYFFALRHLFFRPASSTLSLCAFGKAQRVLSTKHNVCFPQSTMRASHKAQCVLSTKHNVCLQQSTMGKIP